MPTYCYLYVLRSNKDGQFYVGLTRDLRARLRIHNKGLVFSTRRRVPLELVYWEGCLNEGDAAQREKYLKERVGKALHQGTVTTVSHGVKDVDVEMKQVTVCSSKVAQSASRHAMDSVKGFGPRGF